MDTRKYEELAVNSPRGKVLWALIDKNFNSLVKRLTSNGVIEFHNRLLSVTEDPTTLSKKILYRAVWDFGMNKVDEATRIKNLKKQCTTINHNISWSAYSRIVCTEVMTIDQWLDSLILRELVKCCGGPGVKGLGGGWGIPKDGL